MEKNPHHDLFGKSFFTILSRSGISLVFLFMTAIIPLRVYATVGPANGWFVNLKEFSESAHTGISCQQCHGIMTDSQNPHTPETSPDFLVTDIREIYDYSQCEECHPKTYELYKLGAHEDARKDEAEPGESTESKHPAPTCGHCHSAHYHKSHLSRAETGRNMVDVCGGCHPSQESSYLKNFHGKAAVNLGNTKAAYCTDCHGAHACKSLEEDKIRLEACRTCHSEAPEKFGDIVIHYSTDKIEENAEDQNTSIAKIHMADTISFVFVACILIFFLSHSFLLMVRKIHHKLRNRE